MGGNIQGIRAGIWAVRVPHQFEAQALRCPSLPEIRVRVTVRVTVSVRVRVRARVRAFTDCRGQSVPSNARVSPEVRARTIYSHFHKNGDQ